MPDDNRGAVMLPSRIPYNVATLEKFGIDDTGWRALIDAVWPAAKTADAVLLALSYCRARKLDPFKRPIHIVPVYDSDKQAYVEGIWPGIGELRTTAFRTGLYAGRDESKFGDDVTEKLGNIEVTYPEWAQVTVYRLVKGVPQSYAGPRVYWKETYATARHNTDEPNRMWKKRPRGQLDKCAEAAALRAAFPEEMGDFNTSDEMDGQIIDHQSFPQPVVERPAAPRPQRGESNIRSQQTDPAPVYSFQMPDGEIIESGIAEQIRLAFEDAYSKADDQEKEALRDAVEPLIEELRENFEYEHAEILSALVDPQCNEDQENNMPTVPQTETVSPFKIEFTPGQETEWLNRARSTLKKMIDRKAPKNDYRTFREVNQPGMIAARLNQRSWFNNFEADLIKAEREAL